MLKIKLWASPIIFISSYSPLGIILVIKDYDFRNHSFNNPSVSWGILIASLFSVIMLLVAIGGIRFGEDILIRRVSNRSNELVNYTIPYMLSFFGFDLGKWQDMISFGIFMVLMFVLTIRTQSLFINPILAIIGYGLYDVEFELFETTKQGILMSKLDLKLDRIYTVQPLSKFLYFVTGTLMEEENE